MAQVSINEADERIAETLTVHSKRKRYECELTT